MDVFFQVSLHNSQVGSAIPNGQSYDCCIYIHTTTYITDFVIC
jgi:hypothetical protein